MKSNIVIFLLLMISVPTFAWSNNYAQNTAYGQYGKAMQIDTGPTTKNKVAEKTGCGLNQVTFSGIQGIKDDEFLYSNQAAYDEVYDNSGGKITVIGTYSVNSGTVYECDNDYCTDNKFIILDAGHVFKGKKIDKTRAYKCSMNINDRWIPNSNDTIECCDVNYKYYKEINGYGGQYRYKALANAFEVCKICSDTKTTGTKATAAKSETVKPAVSQPVARTTAENTTTTTTKTATKPAAESATPAERTTTVTTTTTVTSTTPSEISNASDTEPKVGDTCTTNGTASATYKQINGKLKCVATACKPNFYLVVNTNGASQGWCTAKINCGDGKEMKIIDNTKTDRTCIDVTTPTDTAKQYQKQILNQTKTSLNKQLYCLAMTMMQPLNVPQTAQIQNATVQMIKFEKSTIHVLMKPHCINRQNQN